ncbi:MAG: hypothetical protein ACJ790_05965 [Myxococcaceae bacterium]
MSVNKAVTRLHNDIKHLNKAKHEHSKDVHDLHKDRHELKKDHNRLEKNVKEGKHAHKLHDRHATQLKKDVTAKQKSLANIEAKRQALIAQYPNGTPDPLNPNSILPDPMLTGGLQQLDAQAAAVKAKYDPLIAAGRANVQKDRATILSERKQIKSDRHEIKHDRNVIKHDHKELKHDRAAIRHDRHKALHDLQPAEYKMGLKGTNRVRKELGLKSVNHVIRPGVGNVSSTMRKLAAAGKSAAMSMGGYVSHGLCATGVSKAIRNAMGISVYGNGNQIDNNLPKSKFKQVHIPLSKALKIPGLILTWEHTSTTAGRLYGHTAITTGDGHSSCSDFIENNTLAGAASRTGLKIFMPI